MSEWQKPKNAPEELLSAVPVTILGTTWGSEAVKQLLAHAALIEENARLKKHAEAMADAIHAWGELPCINYADSRHQSAENDLLRAHDAYRADFPKESS